MVWGFGGLGFSGLGFIGLRLFVWHLGSFGSLGLEFLDAVGLWLLFIFGF